MLLHYGYLCKMVRLLSSWPSSFFKIFYRIYSNYFLSYQKIKYLLFIKLSDRSSCIQSYKWRLSNYCIIFWIKRIAISRCRIINFWWTNICNIASIIFLSEKVGIKRWSAVFLGFLGMLLIVQPAFTDLNYYYITPIVFCIFFACVAISVRSLSKTEANYTIAFYFTFLCALFGFSTIFFTIG